MYGNIIYAHHDFWGWLRTSESHCVPLPGWAATMDEWYVSHVIISRMAGFTDRKFNSAPKTIALGTF